MATYGQDTYTLFLYVHSAQDLSTSANAAFCTTFVWSNLSPGGPAQSTSKPKYTSFSRIQDNQPIEWNEELQLDATNPKSKVLTVRVKDSSDALVGTCNIYLAHLHPGQALDQWFQLHPAGHIHLKLVLTPSQRAIPTPVNNSPYSASFQALLDLELKKRAAAVNEPPLPHGSPEPGTAEHDALDQSATSPAATSNLELHAGIVPVSLRCRLPCRLPPSSTGNQLSPNDGNCRRYFHNLQQLNGTSRLGTVASIGLRALGLGPLGAFFGS